MITWRCFHTEFTCDRSYFRVPNLRIVFVEFEIFLTWSYFLRLFLQLVLIYLHLILSYLTEEKDTPMGQQSYDDVDSSDWDALALQHRLGRAFSNASIKRQSSSVFNLNRKPIDARFHSPKCISYFDRTRLQSLFYQVALPVKRNFPTRNIPGVVSL